MSAAGAGLELRLVVPDELLHALAERVAELVGERIETRPQLESPWLDFEAALAYLGFTRDALQADRSPGDPLPQEARRARAPLPPRRARPLARGRIRVDWMRRLGGAMVEHDQ